MGALAPHSNQDVADMIGSTPRAAENARNGESGFSMASIVAMCRNDDLFRAQFFRFCGGHLENDPAFVAGLSKAISAYVAAQSNAQRPSNRDVSADDRPCQADAATGNPPGSPPGCEGGIAPTGRRTGADEAGGPSRREGRHERAEIGGNASPPPHLSKRED